MKMTKDIDLLIMKNIKEEMPQYRDQQETERKDIFLLLIGRNAIKEMTKTVREREPSSLPLYKLVTLFRTQFTPNVQNMRANFFDSKREDGESAPDLWKRILEVKKNCEFETITAAELLASKCFSFIGKSTGDYDLRKKIRKTDMSVEEITEALDEYRYEKLNDSPETEDEKKNRYLHKRRQRSPLNLISKSQCNKMTSLRPLETKYRDPNDNRIKFEGKTMANVQIDGKQNCL